MLINEKGLCRAMSEAAGHGGYRIRFNEDEETISIATDEWLVNIEIQHLPRKALSLIVEHFGYIPVPGCFSVEKIKDGYQVQGYLDGNFDADVRGYTAAGTLEPAINTGITVWGMSLWIESGGIMRGVSPRLFGIVELKTMKKAQIVGDANLAIIDEDSAVFFRGCGSEYLSAAQQILWESIEKINWWKAKEAETEAETEDDEEQGPEDACEQIEIQEREAIEEECREADDGD